MIDDLLRKPHDDTPHIQANKKMALGLGRDGIANDNDLVHNLEGEVV